MKPARLIPFALVLALSGCALAPKMPQGYLGIQRVTPAAKTFKIGHEEESAGLYFNLLIPLGDRFSFQIEPIWSLGEKHETLLRVAVDVRLF